MIVVLNCFTSWCQNNDSISSTGGLEPTDSLVLIPISSIKIANSKMIELKYEKEINKELRHIIVNDSVIISSLNQDIINSNVKIQKYKKQRNIIASGGLVSLLLLIISLL